MDLRSTRAYWSQRHNWATAAPELYEIIMHRACSVKAWNAAADSRAKWLAFGVELKHGVVKRKLTLIE